MRFVVDSGTVVTSQFEPETGISRLVDKDATVSSQKQRKGRLGRTMPGTYYQLFDKTLEPFPHGAILAIDVLDLEFDLMRTGRSLQKMASFLPEAVPAASLARVRGELETLGIVGGGLTMTARGKLMLKLPVVGGAKQACSLLAGLLDFGCGRDMVRLFALLMGLGNSVGSVLSALPGRFRAPAEGDFASLLLMFDEVLASRRRRTTTMMMAAAAALGLGAFEKGLQRAVVQYDKLQQALMNVPEFRGAAWRAGKDGWPSVCRALAAGYGAHVFWCRGNLQGPKHEYLQVLPEKMGSAHQGKTLQAQLDVKSLAFCGWNSEPPQVVIARDLRSLSSKREGAILSLVGVVTDLGWLKGHLVTRRFVLGLSEHPKGPWRLASSAATRVAEASGSIEVVWAAELAERSRLVQQDVTLDLKAITSKIRDKNEKEWERNLLEASSFQLAVFTPLIYRWRNMAGIEISISKGVVTIKGARELNIAQIRKEFESFCFWVAHCNVIKGPNHSVHPRQLNPAERKQFGLEMEERIARITDPGRTRIDLWRAIHSSNATRESRMEAVAWLAVTKFNVKVEGGFVRDLVVGGRISRPSSGDYQVPQSRASDAWKTQSPTSWIWLRPNAGVPETDPLLTPADIDAHLPMEGVFDAHRFMDELHKMGFSVDYVHREGWRYSIILDLHRSSGPFNLDLIEPHAAIAQDMLDFDVNNLYVTKGYTNALGMRVNLNNIGEEATHVSLSLESIVGNIRDKRFVVLRHMDTIMENRCEKMVKRGWTKGDTVIFVPNRGESAGATFSLVPAEDRHYKDLEAKFASIGKILKIEHISSSNDDELYAAMKKTIRRECGGDENERFLFHGTKGPGIEGIPNNGFDNRYWAKPGEGFFGHGAYFADAPEKSNQYTTGAGHECVIFLCKVLLGKVEHLAQTRPDAVSPSAGYHRINGTNGQSSTAFQEYIVYRYGQAKPYWKITYKRVV